MGGVRGRSRFASRASHKTTLNFLELALLAGMYVEVSASYQRLQKFEANKVENELAVQQHGTAATKRRRWRLQTWWGLQESRGQD